MSLRIVPITHAQAKAYLKRHRHNPDMVGAKLVVGVTADVRLLDGPKCVLVGIAVVGRPVAPALDDGVAAEITRCCTDGTRNACSILYGAARRAARALGHEPIYTYSLPEEGGASLRAAGFRLDKTDAGGPSKNWHSRDNRNAAPVGDDLFGGKWRWIA